MSSKDVIDALADGRTLDAEDAFKNAMKAKMADSLEGKKVEVAKSFVKDHLPDSTETTESETEETDG
jgi:hemerythrin superfamily protein|tara:strand:+ start:2686 stop:2886 length:201 start_codon:yes stop_codon:yes gene_type:complete